MLTGPGIVAEMEAGRLIIDPFNPKHVNPNSYDLTLYKELLVYENVVLSVEGPNPTARLVIPDEGLILQPGLIYLGCTAEYTDTKAPWAPTINGKSTLGRLGIRVHSTAGFGDVGFRGQWTLEIDVVQPIRIKHSIRICQINYTRTEGEILPYNGKYQDQKGAVAAREVMD